MILDQLMHLNYFLLLNYFLKHLDKLNIKYDLIIYDNYSRNRENIKCEVISRRRNKGLNNSVTGRYSCNHYCIRLRGAGVINGNGDYTEEHRYSIPNISYKNIRWIYKNSRWNKCYKVQYNKTIKNIVKEFFKNYEKVFIF